VLMLVSRVPEQETSALLDAIVLGSQALPA
jgi:hypothetical protein